jgi:competence protein ComEA
MSIVLLNRENLVLGLCLVVCLSLIGYIVASYIAYINYDDKDGQLVAIPPIVQTVEAKEENTIYVDISGAVFSPGVYKLKTESRVYDGVYAAGGVTTETDLAWVQKELNLAKRVEDGDKVYIPFKGEMEVVEAEKTALAPPNVPQSKLVDFLNLANVGDLTEISGIGESVAQKILAFREENGGFNSENEILLVSGVGEKTLEKIEDYVSNLAQ